jgi:hypothetical protein
MQSAVVSEITGGGAPFIGLSSLGGGPFGYHQAEYALSGVASAYDSTDDGVSVVDEAAYTTRMLVYRPADPAMFNGTVWVEWLDVGPGYDVAPGWMYVRTQLMRAGSAWVGVTAMAAAVHGGEGLDGLSTPGLVGTDPARYGALTHPGDRYCYDIYTQAGEAARACARTIVGDVPVERILGIAGGTRCLTTYVNDVDPLAAVFDGFLLHNRIGFHATLDDGDETDSHPVQVRAGRVPVISVESETDVFVGGDRARQDDDETFVLWEIAGTAHIDEYLAAVSSIDTAALPVAELAAAWRRPTTELLGIPVDKPMNAGPQHYVMNAAVSHLESWVRAGIRPPHAARLELRDGAFVTDERGIVRGGVRTPHVDVPTAVLSGLGSAPWGDLGGTTTPFEAAKVEALYSSRADYLSRFEAATDTAVAAGFVLSADAAEIKAIAVENSPL